MKGTLTTFVVQIQREGNALHHTDKDKRMLADLPAYMEEIEENLSDLLPEGYEAQIKEWDDE